MFLFIILYISAGKDSHYLGSIKHTLQPNQTFEHQFFDVNQIRSLDLYFPDPPYRMINDEDMNCYWSNQAIGLKPVQTIQMNISNSLDSDIVCFDECFIRQGQIIFTTKNQTLDLQYQNLKSLVLSSEGQIIHYNEKVISIFDTVNMKIINDNIPVDFTQKLRQSIISQQHMPTKIVYLCLENGVFAYNDEYFIINQYGTRCKSMMLQDDNLFIVADGISIYDINDPFEPLHIYSFNISGHFFDIYQDYLAVLELLSEQRGKLSLFKFNFQFGLNQVVNITQESEGTIQLDSQDIKFGLLNKDIAIIINKEQVNLITLQTNFHQKYRHNNGLGQAQHFLDPENKIFIRDSQIIQVSNNSLNFYNTTSQSYNLVCNAPVENKLRKHLFFGIIRSEEKCRSSKNVDERFKELLSREKADPKIQCYYTFQLSLNIIPLQTHWSLQSKILLCIFLFLLILLILQQFKNQQEKQTLNSLQKFEQLNRINLQKQKIRITHEDEEQNNNKIDFY
ncbi:unnamed protein product (macronuclear) [Paramecium tetraurelia]|uniref:Transmembrane protein n=1 Tax=Paramecium tetraurelia TaxID=5888 RepID=A0DS91_PARTE|nr:uncharacterized protein GSPATT00019612001 [Paramecium tetraurelia]CAK85908.1 unnamed protein product [Paramecium tetraurelia]|eukprot:XP_001453305.1 hypothetical protein (macronuclear) [Paramecium tetraurelia strain d4-2]